MRPLDRTGINRSGLQHGCRVLVLGVFAMLLSVPVCAGDFGGMLDDNIQIDGGILDFVKEKESIVLRNHATLIIGETRIRARNMVYNYTTKEVFAEGDVTFDEAGGSAFVCDRLFFDTVEWRGAADNVRAKAEKPGAKAPVVAFVDEGARGPGNTKAGAQLEGEIRRAVVLAKRVQAIDQKHMEMFGAKITPSLFANPHWHIYSAAVNVRKDEKVESWHNFLMIGKVPVFYFPYLIKDLKYDWPWLRVAGGSSSEHGWYVFTKTGLDFDDNPSAPFELKNMFFDIDYRESRGWAFGVESDYRLGHSGKGSVSAYWTNESNTSREDDQRRAEDDNENTAYIRDPDWEPTYYRDTDRYILDWEHDQRFNEHWDLRAEAHYHSDRDFQDEYFEWDSKVDKDPETWIGLRGRYDLWQLEMIAQKRINDWQTQTEYLPELRLNIPGLRFGDLPVWLRSETRIGSLTRRFDEDLDRYGRLENEDTRVKSGDSYGPVTRLFNETVLQVPLDLGPTVLKLWGGGRVAYYDEIYGKPAEDAQLTAAQIRLRDSGIFDESHIVDDEGESVVNAAAIWGADWSTRLYGHFGNGAWRHTLEPRIEFVGQEQPEVPPEWLYYFDDVDAYDEQHYFRFELFNRLERREDGVVREIANFDLSFRYYPLEKEAENIVELGRNLDPDEERKFTDITFSAQVRPTPYLTFGAGGRIDPYDWKFNYYHVSGDWRYKDRLRLYMHHQHYRGEYWRYPNRQEIDRTTFAIRTPLWDPKTSRYALEYALTYDWNDNNETFDGPVEQRLTLWRDLDTFELGVSFTEDKKVDDKGIFVELKPKGWMGIDRPSPVSDLASRMPSRYGETAVFGDIAPSSPTDGAEPEYGYARDSEEAVRAESVGGGEDPMETEQLPQKDPTLEPGADDVEFEGALPTLQGAGSDPTPWKE